MRVGKRLQIFWIGRRMTSTSIAKRLSGDRLTTSQNILLYAFSCTIFLFSNEHEDLDGDSVSNLAVKAKTKEKTRFSTHSSFKKSLYLDFVNMIVDQAGDGVIKKDTDWLDPARPGIPSGMPRLLVTPAEVSYIVVSYRGDYLQ